MRKTINYMARLATSAVFLTGMGMAMAGAPDAAETCITCHGKDGVSEKSKLPTISGASDFYIENQLALFSEGARPCVADYFEKTADAASEDHCAEVEALSEDDRLAVAAYYSEQPFVAAKQDIDDGLADTGQSVHEANCARCHTEGGGLALDDAGILAGQWKCYLIGQLKAYKAGERWKMDSGLSPIKDLDRDEMKALAEFYAREGQ